MIPSWLQVALGATALFLAPDVVSGGRISPKIGLRKGASPGYRPRDVCPGRCNIAGPNPSNWSLYHNFGQIQYCTETQFYEFSLYDNVDDPNALHRIYGCTSFGPDWSNMPNATTDVASAGTVDATYQIGSLSTGELSSAHIRTLSKQMGQYLASGYGAMNKSTILFARSGPATVGIYIGKGLQSASTGSFALHAFEHSIASRNNIGSLAMQFCQPGADGDHIFGFVATSNGTFAPVQHALQSWSNATCLSLTSSQNITGPAYLATPLLNTTALNTTSSSSTPLNSTSVRTSRRSWDGHLVRRGDCTTVQVVSGDSCGSLAAECGISGSDFTTYNPGPNLCSTLQVGQHVCCSAGTLPNFAPQPNADGSCATYTIQSGDYCSAIAATNDITVDQLNSFNTHTWAWNGCNTLWVGTIICLSTGTPPMPAPLANAVCGPQVPGTTAPPAGTNVSLLNPCPLNACCDVWGQCGITAEFCTNTNTGAPGTASPGTNGCISNCGTDIVQSSPPSTYRAVAYFEGFGLGRPCLYEDASQTVPSSLTHLHFAFAGLTNDWQVTFADNLTQFEFNTFVHITGPRRILSIGGWSFSTDPSTYNVFRSGVATAVNQVVMAENVANFIYQHNLDGVDFDWEYPAEPDIPGIPADDPNDGRNYLAFLQALRLLMPDKSISIAAPASYWYLRGFPIADMAQVVDYIIFMTYDLHGQWDAGNPYSQDGCPTGSCLRSDVNLTETLTALAMITKAGVPSNQVIVGVTSYGRSFAMADPGCWTEECLFTGTNTQSDAAQGPCTATAGYIADAEIYDILNDASRVNQNYVDNVSNSNILVYDNNQWVGYMDPSTKATRQSLYQSLSMGGSTVWASDLEAYNDVPYPATSWNEFIQVAAQGGDPYVEGPRTGNWTDITCTDPSVENEINLTPLARWQMMDAANAWLDIIATYQQVDGPNGKTFMTSVQNTLHGPEFANCGQLGPASNCGQTVTCSQLANTGPGDSGAAGYEIWNSFVLIRNMHDQFNTALFTTAASVLDNSATLFVDTFAPVPPPPDHTGLNVLLDFIGMGAAMAFAPFFDAYLAALPFIIEAGAEGVVATSADITYAVIAGGISIAKDLVDGKAATGWSVENQAQFTDYMGQVLNAWSNVTAQALANMWDGTLDKNLSTLSGLVNNGQFFGGGGKPEPVSSPAEASQALTKSITTAYYGYAIPAIWNVSGAYPFIVDAGYSCNGNTPNGDIDNYMDPSNQTATLACVNGNAYYLASATGDTTGNFGVPFVQPPGLGSLDGIKWGPVNVQALVTGSVNSYTANNHQNGAAPTDPTVQGNYDRLSAGDITTPGFIRIPVCSPDTAVNAMIARDTSDKFFPCSIAVEPHYCDTVTFTNETSDASPLVSDCQHIIANIQGTSGEWFPENVDGKTNTIASYGSCYFDVQSNSPGNGAVNYHVGAQDIIDIINTSIQRFASNGKVGSKGDMSCQGDVTHVAVTWGLY